MTKKYTIKPYAQAIATKKTTTVVKRKAVQHNFRFDEFNVGDAIEITATDRFAFPRMYDIARSYASAYNKRTGKKLRCETVVPGKKAVVVREG